MQLVEVDRQAVESLSRLYHLPVKFVVFVTEKLRNVRHGAQVYRLGALLEGVPRTFALITRALTPANGNGASGREGGCVVESRALGGHCFCVVCGDSTEDFIPAGAFVNTFCDEAHRV